MAKANVELSTHVMVGPLFDDGSARKYTTVYHGPQISNLRFRSSAPCTVHTIDFNGDFASSSSFEYESGEVELHPFTGPNAILSDGVQVHMWVSAKANTMMWLTVIGTYEDPTLKEGTASE